jgi:predicted ATP-dependent serine protease
MLVPQQRPAYGRTDTIERRCAVGFGRQRRNSAVVPRVQAELLERDRELLQLGEFLDRVLERRGGVAVVEGPAGIGKTRLLEAVCERAAGRGLRVLSARGGDLERQFA